MRTKLLLKVAGLIGVLALISTGYCFWLMTVPLSYHWVPVVLIGFVASIGVFVISVDHCIYLAHTIASITSCTECSANQADHLTSQLNRQ